MTCSFDPAQDLRLLREPIVYRLTKEIHVA